jgi:formate-dependent nitrite reductase membrane component NrfD
MNPEIFQLAAEHGARSAPVFWGWIVALEMFLSGVAGALLFVAAFRRFTPGVQAAIHRVTVASLLLAGLLLFLDLGAGRHVLQFFVNWQPRSVLFWGSWLFAFSVAAALLRLRFAGAASGFGLMLYPGLLLASMTARPAWTGPWIPIEFLALSLGSGAAVILLVDPAFRARAAWTRSVAVGILVAAFAARASLLFAGQR